MDLQRDRTGREDESLRRELEARRLGLEKERSLLNASREDANKLRDEPIRKIDVDDIDLNLPLAANEVALGDMSM